MSTSLVVKTRAPSIALNLHPSTIIFFSDVQKIKLACMCLLFDLPGGTLLPHLVPEGGPVLDAQHTGAEGAGQLVAAAAAGAPGRSAGALVRRRSGRRRQLRADAERAPEEEAAAAPGGGVSIVVVVFRLRRHGAAEGAQRRRRADGEATAGQTIPRQFAFFGA